MGDAMGDASRLLLDRYRIEGMLGEGGLGTVYRAFDTLLKRPVAVKTLKSSISADPEIRRSLQERFLREAEAGSRMGSNPNLVTIYDLVADADGTRCLICEFVAGGNLADLIRRGPLPTAAALRLTADAARGLQAAHDVGIVHRDVKPANIFLARDGRAGRRLRRRADRRPVGTDTHGEWPSGYAAVHEPRAGTDGRIPPSRERPVQPRVGALRDDYGDDIQTSRGAGGRVAPRPPTGGPRRNCPAHGRRAPR
jgi:serine/threonine protein kinase